MMCLYSIDNLCWKWKWSKENHKMMVKEMAVLNRKSVYDIRWDVFCGVVLCCWTAGLILLAAIHTANECIIIS